MTVDQNLLDYLYSQKLMALATCGEKIWIANVYYAADEKANLYFISDPKTQHGQDMAKNGEVAAAISDSSRDYSQTKIGLQIRGKVKKISGLEKLRIAAGLLIKVIPQFTKYIDPNDLEKIKSADIYKLEPEKIKFFNKDLFPDGGYKVYTRY